MSKILLLTRREISAYFVTPVAYIVMAMFLLFSGVIFTWFDFQSGRRPPCGARSRAWSSS